MRHILLTFAVLFGLTVSLSSCDDCRGMFGKNKVECSNGGTCNNGECDCLKGYSGASCTEIDLCELNDVECIYGDCEEGLCYCIDGFEGTDCSVSSRAKYLGEYNMVEGCIKLDTIYTTLRIEENLLDPAKMYLINMFTESNFPIRGFFSKIEAVPTPNTDKFQIPNQNPDGNERSIYGQGTIIFVDSVTTDVEIDYTIVDGNKTYECNVEARLIQ